MRNTQSVAKNSESGFTLLELMLVVGVSAMMFLGITQITKSWIESERAAAAGRHLEQVTMVMDKFLRANWAVLNTTVLADEDDALEDAVNNGAPSPWNDLLQSLIGAGLLTAADGSNLRSPLNTRLVISYHPPGVGEPRRLAVHTEDAIPNKRALDTARKGGTFAGTVTDFPDANTVTSAFGQWSVARADLVGIDSPPDPQNGFVVGVVTYNDATLYGSYLYRQDVGVANLNQMGTNLDMADNDILDGGTITSNMLNVQTNGTGGGQANIGGTLTVGGMSEFNAPVTATAGLTANRLTVTGDGEFAGNITAPNGDIQAGTMSANIINAPAIQTASFQANNLDVQGNMTLSDELTVQGDMNVTGNVSSNEVSTGRLTSADAITAGQMNVVNNLTIQNGAVLNVGAAGSGGSVRVDRLVADDCVRIGGQVYPEGATGC